jgi:ribonucleoside-diphosphate reductase alpha chain
MEADPGDEGSAVLAAVKTPFPNMLSEFIFTRTYARWLEEEGRRERWDEAVDRYIAFIVDQRPNIPRHILTDVRKAIMEMRVMPSMRALWAAGPAAARDNTCMYNCSFVPLDSFRAFSECLYILMMGTGVGFSVENQFVGNLPEIAPVSGVTKFYTIPDSTDGWADALYYGLTQWFQGHKVSFDYSGIRPAGAILKTKGGRASGPEPLIRLMEFTEKTVLEAAGRKMKSIEAHDIGCMIGEIVMVGGVRRAALISISDLDDEEMRHAKDWSRGQFPEVRYMANNSAFYAERPDKGTFWREWNALQASMSGERGLSIDSWHRRANRPAGNVRTNPCGEIGLRFNPSSDPVEGTNSHGQFCNLTAAVLRAEDTRETFAEKVRIATWLGVIQSTFTEFPYLRPGWKQVCDEDRLLGVDITGQCDNPALAFDPEHMTYFNKIAVETAAAASAVMGVNMPVAITCGKPSGNSSQLLHCASGFHPRYSQYYIRRVRIASTDPLFSLARDSGIPVHKEVQFKDWADEDVPTWVVEFPIESPANAVLRDHETAIEQCDRYLHVMRTWCGERGHNQSATIYVKDHEWEGVGQWVFDNFDDITGLSFLPHDSGKYQLAPYEEITEEQYKVAVAAMPEVDFSLLSAYELEDRGQGAVELACVGGACEIDYDKLMASSESAEAK